ncbi:HutP family protein [Feifania hominis]|uniref:Hut operon positive regulatory protein n=1 Tax=Feifania hominis TaxID=2763660 RepID=A0A926DAP7_9FIRM|nr:HutP family protein [Feifania hominis]MBC8535525.1 HutP family protein [Feifania hominis]
MSEIGSKDVACIAIKMAISSSREEERAIKEQALTAGFRAAAADFGGEFIPSINKIIERAVVAAKREGIIAETHMEEGAAAGAAREAVAQIMNKAIGLNVGGKIGIARAGEHISVAVFFGIGLLHLNEVSIGIGHRVI